MTKMVFVDVDDNKDEEEDVDDDHEDDHENDNEDDDNILRIWVELLEMMIVSITMVGFRKFGQKCLIV